MPPPSHLHPLTHSDSSSGTKLYYPDGETEAQNASLTVNRSRAPGLSALLGPPSLCWTGYCSTWKYFLAFNDSKSRPRHLGTSCASPDPTSTSGNLYPPPQSCCHLQVSEGSGCNLVVTEVPQGLQGPESGGGVAWIRTCQCQTRCGVPTPGPLLLHRMPPSASLPWVKGRA